MFGRFYLYHKDANMDEPLNGGGLVPELGFTEGCSGKLLIIKDNFFSKKVWLEKSYYKGRPVGEVMAARVELADNLIKDIYSYFSKSPGTESPVKKGGLALVAVGGYGRRELYPYSDLDLLFLCQGQPDAACRTLIEKILYYLWDLGLEIGHSVRTIPETVGEARKDFSNLTALLSARYLTGDFQLFQKLEKTTDKDLIPKSKRVLFRFLADDMARRHKEYGSSPYLLEPNIKEGMGGLRDLQVIRWLLKIFFNSGDYKKLKTLGTYTENELATLVKGEEFLSIIRHELHYVNKRRSECLSFENQINISKQLGDKKSSEAKAVETFMQQFYFYAGHIKNVLLDLVQRVEERDQLDRKLLNFLRFKKQVSIVKFLAVREGKRVEDIFPECPALVVEAFAMAQERNISLDVETREAIKRFNASTENNGEKKVTLPAAVYRSFYQLFERRGNIAATLESMHRLGLLGKMLPEFEAIAHLTHHDLYHIYPVDVHSIMAVRELWLLGKGEYKNDLPLLTELAQESGDDKVLRLAALLHDIGKAEPGNHAETGAELATDIGSRLGLSEEETSKLTFLIKHHLYLNEISQRRDLNDERFIIQVAQRLGDIDLLKKLFLLTFADIKAVGGEAWTAWKNMLLSELFFKVLHVLQTGEFSSASARVVIEQRQGEIREILQPEMEASLREEYLKSLPAGYLLQYDARTMAGHVRLALTLDKKPFVYTIENKANSGYSQFTVCTHDSHALFAKICGVMAGNDINILGAQINTWTNGLALDVFLVDSAVKEDSISDERWERFLHNLTAILIGSRQISELMARKNVPTILKEKIVPSYPASVRFDNNFSEFYTLIEVHGTDRLGLLYAITRVLSDKGCYIYKAKITTKANEIIDTFYVQDIFGQKVISESKLQELKLALLQAMEPPRF